MKLNVGRATCDRCGARSAGPMKDGVVPVGWIRAKIRVGSTGNETRRVRVTACCVSCLSRLVPSPSEKSWGPEWQTHSELAHRRAVGQGFVDSTPGRAVPSDKRLAREAAAETLAARAAREPESGPGPEVH